MPSNSFEFLLAKSDHTWTTVSVDVPKEISADVVEFWVIDEWLPLHPEHGDISYIILLAVPYGE